MFVGVIATPIVAAKACMPEAAASEHARADVHARGREAYALWAADPKQSCRDVVTALVGFDEEPLDWYGTQLHYRCVDNEQRLVIISAGRDAVFGTADDLRSDI